MRRETLRRANQPPLPGIEPASAPHLSSPRGCAFALGGCFGGCFGGALVGVFGGVLWFWILAARLKAAGANPTGHDDWGFGLLGCLLLTVPVGAFVGVLVGIKRAERGE